MQRRKNRDLFDLNEGLTSLRLDAAKLIACFEHYLGLEGAAIGRASAERRLLERFERSLMEDVVPLLPVGISFTEGDAMGAIERIWRELLPLLKGEPWKLSGQVIDTIRATRHTNFLPLHEERMVQGERG